MKPRIGVILLSIILILSTAANWTLGQIKARFHASLKSELQTVLMTTSEALRNWEGLNKERLKRYIHIVEIEHLAHDLIQSRVLERKALANHPMQKKIRNTLIPVMQEGGYQGFFIISNDFINLASTRNSNLGQKSLISEEILQRVIDGEILLSLPIRSDVPLPDAQGNLREGQPTMFMLGPINANVTDPQNPTIGILAFRIAPAHAFAQIASLGRLMETGETYLFDHQGKMLSESRFMEHLYETGLLPEGASSILNMEVRNPGGNLSTGYRSNIPRQQQPYTKMAASAISGNTDHDIIGYNDYRGVPVVGAWEWDNRVGIGLATEIDVAEAYHAYHIIRRLVIGALIALSLFAAGVIFLFIKSRERELKQAHILAASMTEKAKKANEALQYELKTSEALANILRHTINATSEKEALDAVLEMLPSLEFLGIQDIGGGFLADQRSQTLTLITEHNLAKPLLTTCAKIKFGYCLCGRAAETGKLQHATCIDDRHEVRFDGIKPHGHYNLPFLIDGQVAGVIVLYLKHGTKFNSDCAAFLHAVADIIAGAIKRIRAEETNMQTERFASLGAMVAGVAHEINTPVGTAVTNVSELIKKSTTFQKKLEGEGIRKSDLENFLQDTKDFSSMAQENLFRAAELVRSFKLVAIDQSSEEEKEFNLLEHINATITTLYHEFKHTEIKIRADCPENLVITSLPGVFSQLITNLAHNSLIHGFEEGERAGEILIKVTQHPDINWLTLTYTDNGKGMEHEQQKKIFDLFYTTRRNQGGSGLGMNIVHNLVTQTLGGEITLESAIEQGVCFQITIPLDANIHHQTEIEKPTSPSHLSKLEAY